MKIVIKAEVGEKKQIFIQHDDGQTSECNYVASRRLTNTISENGAGVFGPEGERAFERSNGRKVSVKMLQCGSVELSAAQNAANLEHNVKAVITAFNVAYPAHYDEATVNL